MKIAYLPTFIRSYKKLSVPVQIEIKEKIELFKKIPNHPFLKVHKLQGKLKGRMSFSVNYEYRIIFQYLSKDEAALLCVGNHDIYK